MVVELFEREPPRLEIVVPFGAQLFVAVVEMLRELVGDLLFAGRLRPQRCQPGRRCSDQSGALPGGGMSKGQALSTPVMRRIALTKVFQVFRWLARTRRPSAVSR